MFRYVFMDVDRLRARNQAKAHGDRELARVKGNLGEIAFHRFCRSYIPIEHWDWNTGDAIRRGEPEYKDYDFELFGEKVDVKARTDLAEFAAGKLLDDRRGSVDDDDILIMVWLRDEDDPDEFTEAMIVGWGRVRELEYAYDHADYTFEGDEGEFEYVPRRPLMELIQRRPGVATGLKENILDFEYGDMVRDVENDEQLLVVEMPDVPADEYEFEPRTTVAQVNQNYSPKSPVVGAIHTSDLGPKDRGETIVDIASTNPDRIYYFPQARLEHDE